ncbi:MAG: iron-sulfur cluster assembly scaffold protein [Candidatus Pacearchaeota archaeon]
MKHEPMPEDMYKEHIMELWKSPENYGILEKPSHKATEYNTTCGDEITMNLKIKNGKVEDVKFSGTGCVISIVSSSLLTEKLKGMKVEEIKRMSKENIMEMLRIKITPARIKCALLPLEATKRALK